jgi:hypothetical protein
MRIFPGLAPSSGRGALNSGLWTLDGCFSALRPLKCPLWPGKLTFYRLFLHPVHTGLQHSVTKRCLVDCYNEDVKDIVRENLDCNMLQ